MKILLISIAALMAAAAGIYWYMLGMPGRSHTGPLPRLTSEEQSMAASLRSHVEAIASRPHNTHYSEELEASARQIEAKLGALGFAPKAQRFRAHGVDVRNIEIVIDPTAASPDRSQISTLVVGAHYDSAGNAPGANDNGSGVAALIEIARLLKAHTMTRTRLRLVFFVNEEPPHFKTETMGSLVYAKALARSGETVRAMLALETLGSYFDHPNSQKYPPPLGLMLPKTGNFVAIVGTLETRPLVAEITRHFREAVAFPSIGGVAPGVLPGITWSDHWAFGQIGVPSVMITDTALFRYPHYHLPSDTPDKLDYERLARVTSGLAKVIQAMAD